MNMQPITSLQQLVTPNFKCHLDVNDDDEFDDEQNSHGSQSDEEFDVISLSED